MMMLVFSSTVSVHSVPITIADDDNKEEDESFQVQVTMNPVDPDVNLAPSTVSVTIQDNDGLSRM